MFLCFYFSFQEDMNLNEEKKTPLREKDLNTKREMVIQYVFPKAVSIWIHEYFWLHFTFCALLAIFVVL